ncbi:hypothetical protein C5167_007068 [Papaver somniferum]|uniref:Uncharacterized protein n=1 Tax=Papaver somniferum TaxID=3469 RepID=A0A4Y7JIJ8_PAPSO|nr:hypothetical protein C5167_007068 [Papaver somniferum]
MEEETWALFEAKGKGWGDGFFDPSLDSPESLRSRVVPARSKAKFTNKYRRDYVRPYAMDALSVYNERAGTKYELVEPGNITTVLLSRRRLHHIDFHV